MKINKLYVGIALSVALLLLGGCDTEMNTPIQSEISNTNTSSQMGIINTHTTVFENITKKLTDNGGSLNGKVDIVGVDKTPAIYFEMVDDIETEVDFSLVRNKGDLVIVYVSPDKTETMIVDTSELDGDAVGNTVTLTLEKGFGEIEFRGDNTIYEFALNFPQLNTDNVSYFDIVPYNVENSNVDVVIENNAAVCFKSTTDNEISADYSSRYHDVNISNEEGDWKIKVSYIGDEPKYPPVVINIPNINYDIVTIKATLATVIFSSVFQHTNTINADMTESSIFYTIPKGFTGRLNATTADSYLELSSDDRYKDCDITLANCASYGDIATGFTKTENTLTYSNGTRTGIVNVDFKNGGYAIIK